MTDNVRGLGLNQQLPYSYGIDPVPGFAEMLQLIDQRTAANPKSFGFRCG